MMEPRKVWNSLGPVAEDPLAREIVKIRVLLLRWSSVCSELSSRQGRPAAQGELLHTKESPEVRNFGPVD